MSAPAINAPCNASVTALGGQWTRVLYIKPISASPSLHIQARETMAGGRWSFRKGKNDHELSGSRHWLPPEDDDGSPPRTDARVPRDRVYVPIRMARSLYARNRTVPWPDANLPARWLLNSRRVPVPPILREGPERVPEIMWQRALLPPHLWRDPAFASMSSAWDTCGS
jgi:hypothetical protein